METYLNISQIIISIVLVIIILMQVREAGGTIFGGGQSTFRTRRGIDKTLFQFTILMGAVFLAVSIASARLT